MIPLIIQFLLVLLIFPAVLFGIGVLTWRWRLFRRLQVNRWWFATLVLWGAWATRLLTVYLGQDFNVETRYYWRVLTNYPLALASLALLITTASYLSQRQQKPRWVVYGVGSGLVLLAFALDPALWLYQIPPFAVADVVITHFSIWAIVWVLSVMLPLLVAWLIAEHSLRSVPQSLYRNQVAYWFATVTLAFIGGILALPQANFISQQIGSLLLSVAGLVGMLAITQGRLPNLQVILRQVAGQIGRILFVTFILFIGLVVLFQLLQVTAVSVSTLLASAIILSILLFAAGALLEWMTRQWQERPDISLEEVRQQLQIGGSLLTPAELSRLFRQVVQTRLQAADCSLLHVQETPGGGIFLTSLDGERDEFEPVALGGENPV